jgi:predicted HicB family RNase H-like nuclease
MAKKKLTLSIDPELIKKAKIKAIEQGVSLSEKVAEVLEEWVKGEPTEEEKPPPK